MQAPSHTKTVSGTVERRALNYPENVRRQSIDWATQDRSQTIIDYFDFEALALAQRDTVGCWISSS